MIICNADNKNVRKFITRKQEKGYLEGANVSVGIDDIFMGKVIEAKKRIKNNEELNEDLKWTIETWDLIVYSAWKSAEPGIVFLERCNKYSNSWYFSPLEATNP